MVDRNISRRKALSGIGTLGLLGLAAMVGQDDSSPTSFVGHVHGELRPVVFQDADKGLRIGSGSNIYEWFNHPFRQEESGVTWFDGHGGVAESENNLFLAQTSTHNGSPHHNIWVYGKKADENGQFKFQGSFGNFNNIAPHGINVQKEDGEEFLYHTFNNGGFVLKTDLEGNEIWRQGKPVKESENYSAGSAFKPTNVAFTREGNVLVSDGYGSKFIHEYTKDGKWLQDFGLGRIANGNDLTAGRFSTSHGLDVFNAGNYDVVTIADRELQRVQHFTRDTNGKFHFRGMSAKTGRVGLNELESESGIYINGPRESDEMGNPCNIRYSDDQKLAVVPELTSRVTLYNVGDDGRLTDVVAHLGDGRPHRPNRGKLSNTWDGYFVTPHYAGFHGDNNDIVVSQYTTKGAGSVLLRKVLSRDA